MSHTTLSNFSQIPRALSVGMAKLIAGSCPQLVFQAVLLGGYTPWSADFFAEGQFPWSQAASIFMSALMIAKTTTEIVIYQRETNQPKDESPTPFTLHEWFTILGDKTYTGKAYTPKTMYDRIEDMVLQLEEILKAAWNTVLSILPLLPLVLSSLIFNTGTLVLTIIVTEWYSAIYIGIVLLLNLTISFILPYSIARKAEEKLGVEYKFSSPDEAEKVKRRRVARGIFASWANLFVFLRPVENISYHKIVHVSLLQPLRFLVNIVTLTIVCHITWTDNRHIHKRNQKISLILTFAIVLAAGILNMVGFRYFYKKSLTSLKRQSSENVLDEEEDKVLSPPPLLLHSTSVLDEENLDNYLDNFPLQAVPSQPVSLSTPESTSNGQFTLTTTRQSKQSVTSVTSRKSVTSVSQFTTVQEGVELEGALADEKSPLLSIAEGATEKGNLDKQMVPYDEEGFQSINDSPAVLTESPDGEMSVSETEVVGPDGRVYTKKVSVRSIKKLSINGKDVDLDNLDDPNSNLTEEEKRQIRLACQNQGMMTIDES